MITQEQAKRVRIYIQQLRNRYKRQYGYQYFAGLLQERAIPERPIDLGAVDAQSIRVVIDDILKED